MNSWVFCDQKRVDAIDPHDRGLAYGDGLFETIRVADRSLPWWPLHLQRLLQGAQRLAITPPDPHWLHAQCIDLLDASDASIYRHGIIKLILTRGVGSRGYMINGDEKPMIVLSIYSRPAVVTRALRLIVCQTQLADQPRLAGIKHLNRLEQVLARAEVTSAGADEGLLCDRDGHVICATSANVVAKIGERWITPVIDRCGVAGVCRRWLLDQSFDAVQQPLTVRQIKDADAVFLCNAVRGILPVGALEDRRWDDSTAIKIIAQRLAQAHSAFQDIDFPQ